MDGMMATGYLYRIGSMRSRRADCYGIGWFAAKNDADRQRIVRGSFSSGC